MNRIKELDAIREDLCEYAEKMAKRMGESAVCLSLFTENYKKGIDSLIQLVVAIMLDKPLYLLVEKGTVVPDKIKRIADGLEYVDMENPDETFAATQRLLEKAKERRLID